MVQSRINRLKQILNDGNNESKLEVVVKTDDLEWIVNWLANREKWICNYEEKLKEVTEYARSLQK